MNSLQLKERAVLSQTELDSVLPQGKRGPDKAERAEALKALNELNEESKAYNEKVDHVNGQKVMYEKMKANPNQRDWNKIMLVTALLVVCIALTALTGTGFVLYFAPFTETVIQGIAFTLFAPLWPTLGSLVGAGFCVEKIYSLVTGKVFKAINGVSMNLKAFQKKISDLENQRTQLIERETQLTQKIELANKVINRQIGEFESALGSLRNLEGVTQSYQSLKDERQNFRSTKFVKRTVLEV